MHRSDAAAALIETTGSTGSITGNGAGAGTSGSGGGGRGASHGTGSASYGTSGSGASARPRYYYGGDGGSSNGSSGSSNSSSYSSGDGEGSGFSSSYRYQPSYNSHSHMYGSSSSSPSSSGSSGYSSGYYGSGDTAVAAAKPPLPPREVTFWERYGSFSAGSLTSILAGNGAAALCRAAAARVRHGAFDVCVLRNLQSLAWKRGLAVKLRGAVASATAFTPADHTAVTEAAVAAQSGSLASRGSQMLEQLSGSLRTTATATGAGSSVRSGRQVGRARGAGSAAAARTSVAVAADSIPAATAIAAREVSRAAQPKLAQAIAARGMAWTAPAVALCCLGTMMAHKESTGLQFATAGSLLAVPLLAVEAHAASQGYLLLRGMGMPRLAAARTFCGVPPLLALVAAPLIGHYAKRYARGYDDDV